MIPLQVVEDGERPSEEVWLQYSVSGGPWVTFYDDWDTDFNKSAAWYSWYDNDIDIPAEAWSASTQFRWYQRIMMGITGIIGDSRTSL